MFRHLLRLVSIALVFALGAATLAYVEPAYAAGYVVNTLADENKSKDGLCSLREAINSANNAGNGDCGPNSPASDVIAFSVSGTIRLGSTLDIVAGQGDLMVNGANKITLSGDTNNDGVGDVRVMYNIGANLALFNLNITLGDAGNLSGGGIVNLSPGTLRIFRTTFSKNSAGSSGGAILNLGTLKIWNSTFINNRVTNLSNGGAISNATPGTMSIAHSTFTGNSAVGGGGAIITDSPTTIITSVFSNNTVTDPNGNGGAIYSGVLRGELWIGCCTIFTGNRAAHGGGIYVDRGQATVTNSTFSNNGADKDGGGITNYGTLIITSSTFADNSASVIPSIPGDGGGIFNGNALSTGKLNVTLSTFLRNDAGRGGGLYNDSYAQIYNSTFAGNIAVNGGDGGGIYHISSTRALYLTYSTLSGNTPTDIFTGNGGVTGGGGSNAAAYVSFTIAANSPGGNCSGSFFWQFDNLATDNTCSGFAQVTPAQLNFGALTGAPAYFPLNPGSVAIDAGDTLLCSAAFVNNQSQNSVTRPQDGNGDGVAICDIGSYEAPR